MTTEVISIIPARGGSIGIPNKNITLLAGKPLIAYSIENALNSMMINRVIVSTDSLAISEVSIKYGAEVISRPPEISGSEAASESALLHVLETLHENENYFPDIVVFLQCTSPLTLPEDIDGTIETLIKKQADTALSVTFFHYFLWKQDNNGNGTGINHDKKTRKLRQNVNVNPQYLETGAIYAMRYEGFLKAKHRFFGKTALYIMPRERCLEIDDPIDLKIAEALVKE